MIYSFAAMIITLLAGTGPSQSLTYSEMLALFEDFRISSHSHAPAAEEEPLVDDGRSPEQLLAEIKSSPYEFGFDVPRQVLSS